jgi:hypothetical protein
MILRFASLVLILFSLGACTEDPPPRLDANDRKLIDSLYRLEVKVLDDQLDSLCDARFDSLVQLAVDSMYTERLAEMEAQLERLKKYKQ